MGSNNDTTAVAAEENALEEASVTMLDVLAEEKEMEETYAAVLGASDEKYCTYSQGGVKRQALYSCLTCCPEVRENLANAAGVCLACSYRCHENHELVELYTKRNFRCDCPTKRFATNRCVLNASLELPQPLNDGNLYNQNFQGLYCTCHRPYPDPERTTEEVMLQCVVCEDWFHLQHLDVPASASKLLDVCAEMICGNCMQQHSFLRDYTGFSLKALEDLDESQANITVTGDVSVSGDDNKLHSDLDKSISDIMGESGSEPAKQKQTLEETDKLEAEEPKSKRQKVDTEEKEKPEDSKEKERDDEATTSANNQKCRRPTGKTDYENGATFWGNDFRATLCQCLVCMEMYKKEKIEFLIDNEDSAKTYEERGKERVASESAYEQGIRALASIDRVQQIDAITEYNRMKEKLKTYLQTFAASKKVVTEEDINRFFEQMRNDKSDNARQPYFCR